ncbi:MAG: quinolinate synthase NadA [Planctomycetes bacterium]|nr:quinolinate synthase NadA [Planctomycetota bacterium]
MHALATVSESVRRPALGLPPSNARGRPALDFASYRSRANEELEAHIAAAKMQLGDELLILGHHYQQDEVFQFADLTGDSFKLSRQAAENAQCHWIVFCGVHFMAETADILANSPANLARRVGQQRDKGGTAPSPPCEGGDRGGDRARVGVILPDIAAGCSMADMADLEQVETCWDELGGVIDTGEVMPVTYVNSAANLKAFCGQRGGIVCTSSNAAAVMQWGFARRPRILFFPDQHLGRNTAKKMGIPLDEMVVWDPQQRLGGNSEEAVRNAPILLWKGHCSVHQVFKPQHVELFRQKVPGIQILVHPECMMEVVDQADYVGSTEYIIRTIREAPAGSRWAIGTELHLVNRLKNQHPDKEIHFLSPMVCMCATMYRIDLAHLCWALENLARGTPVNIIHVPNETADWARLALERMLEVR